MGQRGPMLIEANRSRTLFAPTITSPVTMPRYSCTGRPSTSAVVVTQTPAATLGNYVWRDLNADGVQNETNMGIAYVAVSITPLVAR